MSGSPKFTASQDLPDMDYAAFARGIGLAGINVDTRRATQRRLGSRTERRPSGAPRCPV